METTINQRIEDVIIYTGLSLTAFAKHIGIAQTSLRDCVKNNSEPKYSTLNKIIIANPIISSEWLLLGTGSKIINNNTLLYKDLRTKKKQYVETVCQQLPIF